MTVDPGAEVARLEEGYLHWAPLRDAGHDCQPPMAERRIYAPVGPAATGVAWKCTCDYGTGLVDMRCPYHGDAAQITARQPRPYHSEYLPKGEPGTVWRCACGQPWVVRVRHHNRGLDVITIRAWDRTSERAVTRALRRASRPARWWHDILSR